MWVWAVSWTSYSFSGRHWYLKEQLASYGHSDLCFGYKFSQKWTKPVTLRKTMIRVVANDKSWLSFWELELWKICTHHHELDSFPGLKIFPDEVSNKAGMVSSRVMKCVSIWKIYITQWNHVFFQMSNAWFYKVMHEWAIGSRRITHVFSYTYAIEYEIEVNWF